MTILWQKLKNIEYKFTLTPKFKQQYFTRQRLIFI